MSWIWLFLLLGKNPNLSVYLRTFWIYVTNALREIYLKQATYFPCHNSVKRWEVITHSIMQSDAEARISVKRNDYDREETISIEGEWGVWIC